MQVCHDDESVDSTGQEDILPSKLETEFDLGRVEVISLGNENVQVYEATDRKDNRPVSLFVMSDEGSMSEILGYKNPIRQFSALTNEEEDLEKKVTGMSLADLQHTCDKL